MSYFLGLDLGQAQDPTAIAVVRRKLLASPASSPFAIVRGPGFTPAQGTAAPATTRQEMAFECRWIERLRLGTPYPAVADHVARRLDTDALRGKTQLVVDATGVGRPVVDMLRQRGLEPVAITITGGNSVTFDRGWKVPARDLIAAVQVLLQTDHLKFSSEIPAVPQLVQELLAFRVKIDPLTAHDSYGNREGAHDDMVFAVAVAVWWGQRGPIDAGPFRTIKARF